MNTSAFSIQPFLNRRKRLIERMREGVAILPAAPEQTRSRDTCYPYRADSDFYYLTGFTEPEAVLVLIAGALPKSILFCRARDSVQENWEGYRYGPERAGEIFQFDEAWPIDALDERLPELIANQPALWQPFSASRQWHERITRAFNTVRGKSRAGDRAPATMRDLLTETHAMRLIKDEHEIALMRRAANISAAAHVRAMQSAAPGRYEYEIEAEFLHEFRRQGSQFPAYTTIVASGANACVLHYTNNDRQMQNGELLLIDAGCELDGYAADITRTFPVNGKFTSPQRDIYELVLAAQHAAIAAIKPGASFLHPHEAAARVLAQGMVDLKLLTGSVDDVIATESYKRFYMHRTSHWLGMDVHDVGDYRADGDHANWRALGSGMVLTVEPGCYIRPADDIPAPFHGIGVRIEDDALVTPAGCEVLTAAAPKTIAEIEAIMAAAK